MTDLTGRRNRDSLWHFVRQNSTLKRQVIAVAAVPLIALTFVGCKVNDPARLVTVNPCRIADTRQAPSPSNDWQQISANVRRVHVSGECGLPTNVTSAALTLVALQSASAGFLTAYPPSTERPDASVVNHIAGETRSSSTLIQLGTDGYVDIYSKQADAELIVDTTGGFIPSARSRAGRYISLKPTRILDTREDNIDPILAGGSILIPRPSPVPPDAIALAVNLTAVNNPPIGSFLTAYKPGTSRPAASILNTMPNAEPTAAATIIPITDLGFRLYSRAGQDVIVDVTGYFTGNKADVSDYGLFAATTPTRVIDTRANPPGIYADGTIEALGGFEASAMAMNWTIVNPTAETFLTTYAARTSLTGSSTVNGVPGRATSNFAIDRLSTAGVAVRSQNQTDVVADMTGYFVGTAAQTTTEPAPNTPPFDFVQPVTGIKSGSVYCKKPEQGQDCKSHRGYDITTYDPTHPIRAVADGTVTHTVTRCHDDPGNNEPEDDTCNLGSGNAVQIRHDNGVYTDNYHLSENSVAVEVGEPVSQGQIIGYTGNTGHGSAIHLHIEFWDSLWDRQPANRLVWPSGVDSPYKTMKDGATARMININDVVDTFSTWEAEAPLPWALP